MPVLCDLYVMIALDKNDVSKVKMQKMGTCTLFNSFYGHYPMYTVVFHQDTQIGKYKFPKDFLFNILAAQVFLKPVFMEIDDDDDDYQNPTFHV